MKKKFMILALCSLLLIGGFALPALLEGNTAHAMAPKRDFVQVMLSIGTTKSIDITVDGTFIAKGSNQHTLTSGKYTVSTNGSTVSIKDAAGTTRDMGGSLYLQELKPEGKDYNLITLRNSQYNTNIGYTGDMEFAIDSGNLRAVNHVHLEWYLYGVVPYECSDSWPIEALKTQAVTARGYAYLAMNASTTTAGAYDVGDTSLHQVYRGYNPNHKNSIAAVNGTRGKLVTYGGTPIHTYYSASNGGYTDQTNHVWVAKLNGYEVRYDEADIRAAKASGNKAYSNRTVLYTDFTDTRIDARLATFITQKAKDELAKSASFSDMTVKTVQHVEMHGVNYNGKQCSAECGNRSHITFKLLVSAQIGGEWEDKEISVVVNNIGSELTTLMPDVFNNGSLRIWGVYPNKKGDTVESYDLYKGRWGHGLGLSQIGAQQRAKDGQNYSEILSFYYPGTSLATLEYANKTYPEGSDPTPVPTPTPGDGGSTSTPNASIINVRNAVNVRAGATTSSSLVGTLKLSTRIVVTKAHYASTWHQIIFNGKTAYVHTDYVKLDSTGGSGGNTGGNTGGSQSLSATVTGNGVNYRVGAGTNHRSLGKLNRGQAITVTQQGGTWHQISYNGQTAYMHSAYVSISSGGNSGGSGSTGGQTGTGTVINVNNAVNVRADASTSSKMLGTLGKGKTVPVTHAFYASNWHQVTYNGQTAYIHTSYMSLGGGSTGGGSTSQSAIVNATAVNYRSGPGTNYKSYGRLNRNTAITVLERGAVWHKISYNGRTAYMHSDYITIR